MKKYTTKVFQNLFLIISTSFLIYIFVRSEIYWNGERRDYYYNYYLISFIFIIFSITVFFVNQKIKEYIIISTFTISLSIYFFEGYLTIKKQSKNETQFKEKKYENATGKKWDKRKKIEIYQDLKKINKKTSIVVPPSTYVNTNYNIFPLSSASNLKTIHCNENGYYSIYKSDRYGFNNPDEEWNKKKVEYALVGDSFTHGACVNRPNDIGSVLRNISNKSVLNLGLRGNGPLIEYATLREYLNQNVKKVIWIYFEGNDLIKDLNQEMKNEILMNYINDLTFSQNLKLKQNEIDELVVEQINLYIKNSASEEKKVQLEIKKRDHLKYKLIQFIKIYNTRSLFVNTKIPSSEFKLILKLAKKLVNENSSELYFVYLPKFSRYKSLNYDGNYHIVKDIVNELNIPFIDIDEEVFKKTKNPLKLFPFEEDGHYNVEAYKRVSEAIYNLTK